MSFETISYPAQWIGFVTFIFFLLALDLGLIQPKSREIGFGTALVRSVICVLSALLFNVYIYILRGPEPALEFFTGYLVEQSLSVDNLFVFLIIFNYFNVPAGYQHRVLFYGILGALVMRGVFIALGIGLIQLFDWLLYVFGLILVISGFKLAFGKREEIELAENKIIKLCYRFLRVTDVYHSDHFFVRQSGMLYATPLFVVLIMVEVSDIIFAVDSIPAIFAITLDPFVVFTSNIFAILGLRSFYFLLAGALERLRFLNIGLSLVLVFVGIKMLLDKLFHIPTLFSLGVIIGCLGLTVIFSIAHPVRAMSKGEREEE